MGGKQSILDNLFSTTAHHVVMLGLDGAGKTTVLYRLRYEQYVNTAPTVGFNCEKVRGNTGRSRGVHFTIWDVGGQEKLRPLWNTYTRHTEGIIFVVDSCDTERMEEARVELAKILRNRDHQGVPVLVVANKQDMPGARTPAEIEKLLHVGKATASMNASGSTPCPVQVHSACAIIGEGLYEAVAELYEMMLRRKKGKKDKKGK